MPRLGHRPRRPNRRRCANEKGGVPETPPFLLAGFISPGRPLAVAKRGLELAGAIGRGMAREQFAKDQGK
jgi:hypothetical protein